MSLVGISQALPQPLTLEVAEVVIGAPLMARKQSDCVCVCGEGRCVCVRVLQGSKKMSNLTTGPHGKECWWH